jgi:tetratricopeptide (TPR) repeat protein
METILPSLQEIQESYKEANSYVKAGQQLRKIGYAEESEGCLLKATELYQNLVEQLLSAIASNKLIQISSNTIQSPLEEIQQAEKQRQAAAKLLNDSKQLEQAGKLDEAIDGLRQAMNLNPNLPWIYHSLGDIFRKKDRLNEATNCYCECIRLSPETPWSYHALGDILTRQGKANEAISMYQWALRIDPSLYWTHNALGGLYENSRRLEEAEHHYRQAIEIDSNIEQAKVGLERVVNAKSS